jgi:tRNA-dihydrouridine synthase
LRYESLKKLNPINTYEALDLGRFKSVKNRLRSIFKKENTTKSKYEIIDDAYSNDYIKVKLSSTYDQAILAKSLYDSPIIKFKDLIQAESKNDELFLLKNSNKISSQLFDSSKQVYYENAKCVAEFKYDIL